jgi:hypothetical protein
MKVLSDFFRFIAVLILLFFIIAFPLSLLGRDIAGVLFSPDRLKTLIDQHVLDINLAATVVEQAVDIAILQGDPEREPLVELALVGTAQLSSDQIVELLELMAPRELLSYTLASLIDGYFDWLRNDQTFPEIVIDLIPWKQNFVSNAVPILELMLNALPQCSQEEIDLYDTGDANELEDIPKCRPPEPTYSRFLTTGAVVLPAQLELTPDQVDLPMEVQATPEEMLQLKQGLRRMRLILDWGWVIFIMVFVVGVVFGVRTIVGFFNWAGIPLLITGISCLMLALGLFIFSDGIVQMLMTNLADKAPLLFVTSLRVGLNAGIFYVVKPLFVQAVLQIFLGGGLLVLGIVFASALRKNKKHVAINPAPLAPPPVDSRTQDFPRSSARKRTVDPKDDDRPSGMFG